MGDARRDERPVKSRILVSLASRQARRSDCQTVDAVNRIMRHRASSEAMRPRTIPRAISGGSTRLQAGWAGVCNESPGSPVRRRWEGLNMC